MAVPLAARPVVVTVVNDFEVVVAALIAEIERYRDRVHAVAARAERPLRADVALVDPYGEPGLGLARVRVLATHPVVGHVALLVPRVDDQVAARALGAGAHGVLARALPSVRLVEALEAVAGGEQVVARARRPRRRARRSWPGGDRGLSQRESELLALLALGLGNREMADCLLVAESTVKTHLQNLYAKLGVHNRTQAAAVALGDPGFARRPALAG